MEVIQGDTENPIDWVDVRNNSKEQALAIAELDFLNETSRISTP